MYECMYAHTYTAYTLDLKKKYADGRVPRLLIYLLLSTSHHNMGP